MTKGTGSALGGKRMTGPELSKGVSRKRLSVMIQDGTGLAITAQQN